MGSSPFRPLLARLSDSPSSPPDPPPPSSFPDSTHNDCHRTSRPPGPGRVLKSCLYHFQASGSAPLQTRLPINFLIVGGGAYARPVGVPEQEAHGFCCAPGTHRYRRAGLCARVETRWTQRHCSGEGRQHICGKWPDHGVSQGRGLTSGTL